MARELEAEIRLKQMVTDLSMGEICRISPVDPNAPVLRVRVNKRIAHVRYENETELELTLIVEPKGKAAK